MSGDYRLHGLDVVSAMELAAGRPRAAAVDGGPAVRRLRLRLADPVAELPRVSGDRIAEVDDPRTGRHYVVRHDKGVATIEFAGTCVVEVHPDGRVIVHRSAAAPEALISVLVSGPALVAAAALHGRVLLHASAVLDRGRILAFFGPPGRGKSSLAALVASATRPLVSDDALAVEVLAEPAGAGSARAWRGTLVSRLRSAHPEADAVSADSRWLIDARGLDQAPDVAPLGVLVSPLLSAAYGAVRATAMAKSRALLELAQARALDGMADAKLLARHFDVCGQLVDRVPVVELEVPWSSGRPPAPELGAEIAAELAPWCAMAGSADA